MKKLKLSLLNVEGAEILTREQLKKVMGGDDGSGEFGLCDDACTAGESCTAWSGLNQVAGTCKKGDACNNGSITIKPYICVAN